MFYLILHRIILATNTPHVRDGATVHIANDDAKRYLEEGNRLYEAGKRQEAIDSYDKAIAIDPKLAQAWYNRGNALSALGKHQEAIDSSGLEQPG